MTHINRRRVRPTRGEVRLVVIYLATHADPLGTTTATIEQIQRGTGLTEDSVRRALRELESDGVIQKYPPLRPASGCRYLIVGDRRAA